MDLEKTLEAVLGIFGIIGAAGIVGAIVYKIIEAVLAI